MRHTSLVALALVAALGVAHLPPLASCDSTQANETSPVQTITTTTTPATTTLATALTSSLAPANGTQTAPASSTSETTPPLQTPMQPPSQENTLTSTSTLTPPAAAPATPDATSQSSKQEPELVERKQASLVDGSFATVEAEMPELQTGAALNTDDTHFGLQAPEGPAARVGRASQVASDAYSAPAESRLSSYQISLAPAATSPPTRAPQAPIAARANSRGGPQTALVEALHAPPLSPSAGVLVDEPSETTAAAAQLALEEALRKREAEERMAARAADTARRSFDPIIVCYLASWSTYRPAAAKFTPDNVNPFLCTHLIYAFAGISSKFELKPFDSYNDITQQGFRKFTSLKDHNRALKTLIAVGGWNEGSAR